MVRKVDCLVGLQYGSEGKGKIAGYLSNEYDAMVRSGGPQAGHTFYHKGKRYVNRQLPCGVVNPSCKLYIPPNGLVNVGVFAEEVSSFGVYPDRLMIDPHVMVITKDHILMERDSTLGERLASTLEGVGAAQAEKICREAALFCKYAQEDPELYFFCGDMVNSINDQIARGHSVLIEGTQGFGLSLNHGRYPYVTSRDVSAAALLSDSGISPAYHNQTIGVLRTYPIRVGGNSGPTGSNELSWGEITARSGSPVPILEHTSVTNRVRRVFEQDCDILEKAIRVNKPDQLALTFVDYINHEDFGKMSFEELSPQSRKYIEFIEDMFGVPVTLIGTGPEERHMVDRRTGEQRAVPAMECGYFGEFPENFYGVPWDLKVVGEFIDRKMVCPETGNPLQRRIFAAPV